MDNKKLYFFLKLNPPRPTFPGDMSEEERNIMMQHAAYWKELMDKDIAIIYGPVLDPNGVFGVGIVSVDNEETLNDIIANDPANGLNKFEAFPMKAITK